MRYFKFITLLFFIFQLGLQVSQAQTDWSVTSPSGQLKMELFLNNGQLSYRVLFMENEMVKPSPLGMVRNDANFGENLVFGNVTPVKEIIQEHNVITGKSKSFLEKGNELAVTFSTKNKKLTLVLRAYDDGVAFRYVFPETQEGTFVIEQEHTGFYLPKNEAWIQPYGKVDKYTPGYEGNYTNGAATLNAIDEKNGWCFPALFRTDLGWVLLTEAGLDGNFYGAHLNLTDPEGHYTIRLPEKEEALGLYSAKAHAKKLPWASPWRVIMVGQDLGPIVASNIVSMLSPSNRLTDTSWIRPGRVSWSWLTDHGSPKNFNTLKDFVDLSAEMGWEYSLVDANWNMMKGGNLKKLARYAEQKGVGILLWYNSAGPHNTITEQVRNLMHLPEKRKAEFKKIHSWGIKGIKVDFFLSDKQEMNLLYKGILEDAAEQQLLVNFHGCTIPKGWSVTYPNLMTMESVRGGENYSFIAQFPETAPVQNTILPVTRNVVGPMDYTPVIFSDLRYKHRTTYAHELALSVLFESGLLHFGDHVKSYLNLPEDPKEFLKAVPVTWDETRYVTGWPGKDMVLARRQGTTWYVAGVNGENRAKTLTIPLDFLDKGYHEALFITDKEDPKTLASKNIGIAPKDPVKVDLMPYGGFVLRIP